MRYPSLSESVLNILQVFFPLSRLKVLYIFMCLIFYSGPIISGGLKSLLLTFPSFSFLFFFFVFFLIILFTVRLCQMDSFHFLLIAKHQNKRRHHHGHFCTGVLFPYFVLSERFLQCNSSSRVCSINNISVTYLLAAILVIL